MSNEVRVFMRHIREAKMCSGGTRVFFKRHGLDWSDFLKNGIRAELLEQTNDEMAIHVAQVARDGRA